MDDPMDVSDQEDVSSYVSDEEEREEDEWTHFFLGQDYDPNHSALSLALCFQDFMSDTSRFKRRDRNLYFEYACMRRELPASFMEGLSSEPSNVYPAMQLGAYKHFKAQCRRDGVLFGIEDHMFNIRILDWPLTSLKNIKAHCIGKLLAVSGTVIRVSGIKPLVTSVTFRCNKCMQTFVRAMEDGRYGPPVSCPTPTCKGKKFEPLLSGSESQDWQSIRVQESVKGMMLDSGGAGGAAALDTGRMPRIIDIELLGDSCDSCVPGDIVCVTGIVKREASDRAAVRKSKNKAVYTIYLEAKTVVNSKQAGGPGGGGAIRSAAGEEYDNEELLALRRIAECPDVFGSIVNSLCPSIYGHELVKAGLCLALFGGTQRKAGGGTLRIRGDPHVLIVGDPGLGKSQMLRAVNDVAPRGVYVCGSYSSSSGLTVSLMKEPGSGDYVLEAGALVLADQGVCAIDEFDKMPNEHQSLLEAMEQQSISVAKAGIVCTLMARTSVIAAANPVGGHYDRAKTIAENLKISPALLSRFDLIFILLDKPDESIDKRLSEHVMALHGNIASRAGQHPSQLLQQQQQHEGLLVWASMPIRGASQHTSCAVGKTLCERLRITSSNSFLAIPPKALRKYIAYARRYVHPKLSDEAAAVLQNFYLRIRAQHTTRDSTPITNRQLESLIRLSEARARLELRNVVTLQDAEEVVELMEECMFSSWEDQFGNFDVRRSTGMSKSGRKTAFVTELNRIKDSRGKSLFTMDELKSVAKEMGIFNEIEDFFAFISEINTVGFLTKAGQGQYELR